MAWTMANAGGTLSVAPPAQSCSAPPSPTSLRERQKLCHSYATDGPCVCPAEDRPSWGRDHPCVLPTQRSALNINNNKGRGFSAAMVWKKTQINFPTPFLSVSASESKKHNLLQSYQIRAVARALSGQLRSAEESGAGGALFRPRLPAGLALSRGGSCSSPGPTMPRVPGHPPGVPGTHRETRQENGGVRLGSGLGSCVLKAIIF